MSTTATPPVPGKPVQPQPGTPHADKNRKQTVSAKPVTW
jgi:hypothetical protein